MKIFKYELPIQNSFTLDLPQGTKILAIQVQKGIPCIVGITNRNAPLEERKFKVLPIGGEVDDGDKYIGDFQVEQRSLIYLLFEV